MFLMPPEDLTYNEEHKKQLQETQISEYTPGMIIHDFDAFLTLINEKDVLLTPSHQIAISHLAEINECFAEPIELDLKRPQLKSYPYIQGLFLLLRASGLTWVDTKGKKPILKLDDALYKEWQALNMTERYCTLLETWLLRGNKEIIGERGRNWGLPDHLSEWQQFYHRTAKEGLQVKGNNRAIESIKFFPGLYNIALLDLFGCISIKRGKIQVGEGWQIDSIEHTAFGKALLALLVTGVNQNIENMYIIQDLVDEQTGLLQSLIQPVFPAWQNNLSVSQTEFREGTYIFKVSLGKKVWSRIEIGAKQVLDELAYIILVFANFDSDHLYQFSYQSKTGTLKQINHPYLDDPPFTTEFKVGDLPLDIGQSMTYLFDFGDSWEFDVVLENIEEGGSDKSAKILESHGTPPEQYPNWDDDY